jgi:hypothetical protein
MFVKVNFLSFSSNFDEKFKNKELTKDALIQNG